MSVGGGMSMAVMLLEKRRSPGPRKVLRPREARGRRDIVTARLCEKTLQAWRG